MDFDKSRLDEPEGSTSIHLVFKNNDGDEWTMFIEPGDNNQPQIIFMTGPGNKSKFFKSKFQSFESLNAKLKQLQY